MAEFLTALRDYAFMQNALAAGLLASVACGVMGTYVVTRRITYLAGGIAHCVLGGMGVAQYLRVVYGLESATPLVGAVVAAVLAALVIGTVSLRAKQREDTVIGGLWAVGMATGILFLSRTPGYNQDLMSYLFGNILMVSRTDLKLLVGLDLAVIGIVLFRYKQFLAVCFDEEYARLRGIRVNFYYLLLLVLTALTVVILSTVVGIILVIALLTLPAATAGLFTRTLAPMMLLAVLLSAAVTTAGLALSYGPDLPAGATIVLTAGALYLATLAHRALANRRSARK